MSWGTPHYLESTKQRPQLRYVWNENNLKWVYTVPEGVDLQTVPWAKWIDAAICGLTIATVQWVVFRLQPLHSDRTPEFAIEAAWCANIDRHYCKSLEFSRREWTGPIRGPLLSCMNLMHEALFECPDASTKPVHCPALAAQLVEHVCNDSHDPFHAWWNSVVNRLDRFYRAPDPLADLYGDLESGMVVPPQAFDPSLDFDIKNAPAMADALLRGVDYQHNPRLVPPEQMLAEGFKETPYRYSS